MPKSTVSYPEANRKETDGYAETPYELGGLAQLPAPLQPQLFNPDLEIVQYIAENGTFELTFDGAVKSFWLNQKQIAALLGLAVNTVSEHISNFRRDRNMDADSVIRELRITAADGKSYEVEHYNHQVVMYVGYRARVNDRTIRFQRFVERIVSEALENASRRAVERARLGRAQDVTAYILDGKPRQWAETRVDTKATFKSMMAQVSRVCSAKKAYGMIVSAEYVAMLGDTAENLKTVLGAKNIRDNLPEVSLTFLKTAEVSIATLLTNYQHMSALELKAAAERIFVPLGNVLRELCETVNLDRVTGARLYHIDAGKDGGK